MDGIRPLSGAVIAVALPVLGGLLLVPAVGVQVGGAEPPVVAALDLTGPDHVVYDFVDALDSSDVAAAANLIAEDAEDLALPGLPARFVGGDAGRRALRAALGFYAAVIDVDVIHCGEEDPRTVKCEERVTSAFAQAVGIAGRVVPVTYTIDEGRITSIRPDATGSPALDAYCDWVGQTAPGLHLFGDGCVPVATAESASNHRRLAHDFVTSGAIKDPSPG